MPRVNRRLQGLSEALLLDFDIVMDAPVAALAYVVPCWKCAKKFNVESAHWCQCDSNLRTLECPNCASCFCDATFAYKRAFWNDAPNTLREHTGRFRVAVPSARAPGVEDTKVSAASARRPHVLIVDDEEPIRSLAACYVEQMGYDVTTVSGAEEALRLSDEVVVDIVLTDALMPKMDGRELSRRLKQAHGSRIKVVLMTALYTARRFQAEARNVFMVDEYLSKPLRYEALRDALHRVAPPEGRLTSLGETKPAAAVVRIH